MDNKNDRLPGEGEDETRADWSTNVNAVPPDPASPPPVPPVMPPPPVTPTGPPPGVTLAPPGAPVPWAPVGSAAGAAWVPPAGEGRYAVPGVAGLEFAGGAPRFVAYVIDAIIVTIANLLIAIPATVALFAVGAEPGVRAVVLIVIGILVDAAYFLTLWRSEARATLGMRLLQLQVGNAADGRRLDPGQAFRRWVALASWLSIAGSSTTIGGASGIIGLIWLAWALILLLTTISSPTKQGLHDRFAETAVVRRVGSSNSLVVGCLVIIVLLFGALALAVFISFGVLAALGGSS